MRQGIFWLFGSGLGLVETAITITGQRDDVNGNFMLVCALLGVIIVLGAFLLVLRSNPEALMTLVQENMASQHKIPVDATRELLANQYSGLGADEGEEEAEDDDEGVTAKFLHQIARELDADA